MRLNGWQRIGVVLSVVWAIGAFFAVRQQQVEAADRVFRIRHDACAMEATAEMTQRCHDAFSLQDAMHATAYWPDVAFMSLAPVAAGWLVAWLVLRVVRWIRAGF